MNTFASFFRPFMNPVISQISFHGSSINCYRWGEGAEIIVALHGFGESGKSFAHWGRSLPQGFTLFAPDLPFHGSSTWQEGKPFTVAHLRDLIGEITSGAGGATGRSGPTAATAARVPATEARGAATEVRTAPGRSFTLCGYSMGGRLSLHFYQHFPELVNRLVLVAPDGLKVNFWYWLSTQTRLGNRFFHYTMEHPGWFLGSVKRLGQYGILNKGVVKYTRRYLGEADNRRALYTIWTCMRHFSPDLRLIKALIRLRRSEVRMIFGQYDQIIRPSQGYRFLRNIGGHCTLRELPTGHQLLLPAFSGPCLQIVTG